MKPRLAVLLPLLLLLGVPPALGQSIGAYFTRVNTYIYTEGPRDGRRYLVRPRLAFNVVDVTLDEKGVPWYKIIYPPQTVTLEGPGWTAQPPHALLGAEQGRVLVFSRIPADEASSFEVYRVPVSGIEVLNESQPAEQFAPVNWQKVRYALERPLQAWARGTAGIYRAGKTDTFFNRVYGEMVTRNVDKDERFRLLSGVVRIGDSLQQVRWALGDPLRSQEETIATATRIIWQYAALSVVMENGVVKQIN